MGNSILALEKAIPIPRRYEVRDMVRRVGIITPDKVFLRGYPLRHPVSIFNPGSLVDGNTLHLYARITVGYFTYSSAVVELSLSLNGIGKEEFSDVHCANLEVIPDNRFDIWGVEDPRVYTVEGKRVMTYCGRTVAYFDARAKVERTLPITAIHDGERWKKLCVFRMEGELREKVVSDKNAFLFKGKSGYKLFHRLHMADDRFYLVVSDVKGDPLSVEGFTEMEVTNTRVVAREADFEEKIGWGTPPVKVNNEYLVLLHGLERYRKSYNVFAALIDEEGELVAATPYYIMAPREIYEVYGDRPYTVFPCGCQIHKDRLIVTYGAGDTSVGVGEIDLEEILEALDFSRFRN